MSVLHWSMRDYLHLLRDEGRLNTLIGLMLHTNVRMRCWPGTELLMKETGLASATLTKAKRWLKQRGAFVLVPHSKRVDEEKALPKAKQVYQLTGVIVIDGKPMPYLFMTPEAFEAVSKVVTDLTDGNISLSEKSLAEKSLSETKGITSVEGGSKSKASNGKPRKRNEAADAVTIHFFETELGTNPETEKQAAITAAWMVGGNAPKNLNIQKLEQGLTVEEIVGVARFFRAKNPDASMPRSLTKIARWTWDYIAAGKPAAPASNGANPLAGFKEYTGKDST